MRLLASALIFLSFTEASFAIRDGHPASDIFPQVVHWEASRSPEAACTAVVVSDKVLVSAAHCLVQINKPSRIKVAGKSISVAKYYTHPQLSSDFGRGRTEDGITEAKYDILLIQLERPLDSYVAAQLENRSHYLLNRNISKAFIVGAGPTKIGNSRYGRSEQHSIKTHYTEIQTSAASVLGLAIGDHSLEKKVVCQGDSGGGVFVDGKLYGVLSARFQNGQQNGKRKKIRSSSSGCSSGLTNSLIVDLGPYVNAIQRLIYIAAINKVTSSEEIFKN